MREKFFEGSREAVTFLQELAGEVAAAHSKRHSDSREFVQMCICNDFVVGMALSVIRDAVKTIPVEDLVYTRYWARVVSNMLELNTRYLRRGLEVSAREDSMVSDEMWDLRNEAMNGLAELSQEIRNKWNLPENEELNRSAVLVIV